LPNDQTAHLRGIYIDLISPRYIIFGYSSVEDLRSDREIGAIDESTASILEVCQK